MRIIPIHPDRVAELDEAGGIESTAPRRTFGGKWPSRRTFGGKFPSRRTFGGKFPSQRVA